MIQEPKPTIETKDRKRVKGNQEGEVGMSRQTVSMPAFDYMGKDVLETGKWW